jgi:LmbE family N-acetylglucosaminyl deacetylase
VISVLAMPHSRCQGAILLSALLLSATSLLSQSAVMPRSRMALRRDSGATRSPQPLEAFIVAHPDDWQLFMGDVAVAAVRAKSPTLFVVVTAGDAGRTRRYWQARERGAIASMLVAYGTMPNDSAQLNGDTVPPAQCSWVVIDGQRLRRCSVGKCVTYFLRLPDGNLDGTGFAVTGRVGLAQLESGRSALLTSVDSASSVGSWSMLSSVVRDMVRAEATRAHVRDTRVRLHAQDPDSVRNPNDHSDHRAVGRLAASLATAQGWALTYYADYSITQRPVNRSATEFGHKAAVFMAYDRARILADSTWSAYVEAPRLYSSWLSRTYSHVERPLVMRGRKR